MLNPQTQFIHIISDCCPEDKRNINRCRVYMKVEVLEASGEPIPGFSGDSAKVYRGFDNLRLEPIWKGNASLSSLRGKEVRFKFHLSNAKLHAFQIC